MKETLVIGCSPRPNGVTAALASAFREDLDSMSSHGFNAECLFLRSVITPCDGCGVCHTRGKCRLAGSDDAENIFAAIQSAKLLVFFSPIYFYGLPANFKALIDRSQRFWRPDGSWIDAGSKTRSAVLILTAGRKRGRYLFSGAELTLKWFLKPFSDGIEEIVTMRGLNEASDLAGNHCIGQTINDLAHKCVRLLERNG